MKKSEVVFIRILAQLILLPPICFFIFGFIASFEYTFPNLGHLTYFCLLVGFLWLFIRLSTSLKWHKIISYCIASILCLFLFSFLIQILINSSWGSSLWGYLYSKKIEFMTMYHNFQYQIGKLIAKLIGK